MIWFLLLVIFGVALCLGAVLLVTEDQILKF
jgi:hypothetical protein